MNVAVYVSILLIFLFGAWRSPPSCVSALYCLFPLKQLGQSSVASLQVHSWLTNVFVGLIVVLALFRSWSTLRQHLRIGAAAYVLAASIYAYALCSTTWTLAQDDALQNWSAAWPYIVTSVLLTPLAISDVREMRIALRWLIWTGGLICLVLLVGGDWGSRGLLIIGNDGEFESNPLAISATAGTVVIVALIRGPTSKNWIETLAAIIAGVSAIFLTIRSGSRGELIAAIVAVLAVAPMRFSLTKLRDLVAIVAVFSVLAVGLVVGMSHYMAGGDARWTSSTLATDAAGRLDMAFKLLDRWSQSGSAILFGLGNSASFDSRVVGFYPHVMPIEILGEEGVIGFSLFVGLLIITIRSGFAALKSAADRPLDRDTIAASVALVLFALIVSSKQGNLLGNYMLFTSMIIVCRISTNPGKSSKPVKMNRPNAFSNLMT